MDLFIKPQSNNTVTGQKETESQPVKKGTVNTQKYDVNNASADIIKKRYIAFDVETTGLRPLQDRIIEVGAVLFENGKITDSYGSLVNAGIPVPYAASQVNHITDSMLKNAPSESTVYSDLVKFFGNALRGQTVICAHNARFDMSFLSQTLMRLGMSAEIRYADTLSLSRSCVKGLTNYRQDTVAAYFDLHNSQAHRAVSDAEICGKIMWNLLENF